MGLYVGEGLRPVLVKLVGKIHKWEVVDMVEMFPKCWRTVQNSRAKTSRRNPLPVAKKKRDRDL